MNVKITKVDQEKEPEKWLDLRKTGIGGSDAGALMGMNEYSSPLTVYLQKKGLNQEIDSEILRWGHLLENPIREEVATKFGVTVTIPEGMYTSEEHSFMNANLDGLVEGTVSVKNKTVTGLGGLEIKTSNGQGFGEYEIPDSYYCQVQHYMAVTGLNWFLLAAFMKASCTIQYYIIEKDDEFIEKLIEVEKDFWENYVLKDVFPAPSGADNENQLIKKLPISNNVELDESLLEIIEYKKELDEQIKELKKNQEIAKNQILLAMHKASNSSNSDSKSVVAELGDFKITYSTVLKKSVDSDLLKKEGIYDMYTKETKTKTLLITKKKDV